MSSGGLSVKGPCLVILCQSEKCADIDTREADFTYRKNNKMYGCNVTVIVHSEIYSMCQ
jgi:hypothetical protein